MRDAAMLLMMVPLLVLACRSAFSAYVLWGWASLLGVGGFMYGFMRGISYAQWFAILTLVVLCLKRDPLMPRQYKADGLTLVTVLYALHVALVALFAYEGLQRNVEIATNVEKVLLFNLLMPLLVTNRDRVHVMVVMIVAAVAAHGLVEGGKFLVSGGGHISQGSARFGDNNHYAVHIVMVIPLIFYLLHHSGSRLTRWALGFVLFLCVLAVISTYSRGGFIGLLIIAGALFIRSRQKVSMVFLGALGYFAVVTLAPERWLGRMSGLKAEEGGAFEGASFMGRVTAWRRASGIAMENPIFGGGFHSGQNHGVWERFKDHSGLPGLFGPMQPEHDNSARAAHSIYFEALGDMGFVGLGLFLLVMLSAFVYAHRTHVAARARQCADDAWAVDLARAISVSMLGYFVSGASVSMAYVDLPYILVGLMAVVPVVLAQSPCEVKHL